MFNFFVICFCLMLLTRLLDVEFYRSAWNRVKKLLLLRLFLFGAQTLLILRWKMTGRGKRNCWTRSTSCCSTGNVRRAGTGSRATWRCSSWTRSSTYSSRYVSSATRRSWRAITPTSRRSLPAYLTSATTYVILSSLASASSPSSSFIIPHLRHVR